MSEGESLQADSASRNERPAERSVMPTAGDQLASLARWLANERDEAEREMWQHIYSDQLSRGMARRDAMQAFDKVIGRLSWASESNNARK
jgi:hypothetical protein